MFEPVGHFSEKKKLQFSADFKHLGTQTNESGRLQLDNKADFTLCCCPDAISDSELVYNKKKICLFPSKEIFQPPKVNDGASWF